MSRNFIASISGIFNRINSILASLSGYIVAAMNLIVLYAVIMRYFFARPPIWTTETATFMLMFITFIPLGFAFQKNQHIQVDFIFMRLSDKTQNNLSAINAFLGAGFAAVLFWQSCRLLNTAFRLEWVTMETGTPLWYPLIIMPVGFAILFLACGLKGLSALFQLISENREE